MQKQLKNVQDFKYDLFKVASLADFSSCQALENRNMTLLLQILSKSLLHSNGSLQLSLPPPRKHDFVFTLKALINNKHGRRKNINTIMFEEFAAAFI